MAKKSSKRKSSCKKGYVRRKSHTRKSYKRSSGVRVKSTRVKSNCIKRRSNSKKMPKMSKISYPKHKGKRTSTKGCKKGYIRRSSYSRKSYKRSSGVRVKGAKVKSKCIKMTGSHGLRVIPKLRKGELKKYGYSSSEVQSDRHKSLSKAVKSYGATSVFRKLNVLATFNKNRSPVLSRKFKSDRNWVKSQ